MNKKLDLTTILKDCPKGTEFYSRCIGVVKFDSIDNTLKRIIVKDKRNLTVSYKKNGVYYYADENAEIDLFPSKDQRDWSKWLHRLFKDGDILSYQSSYLNDRTIYIYKYHTKLNTSYYVALSGSSNSNFMINDNKFESCALNGYSDTARFATEEEKQRLFDAIESNGYKWNAETKTLEKLIVPKFKVGDKIKHKIHIIKENIVTEIKDTHYILDDELALPFINQDNYELLPNKFDLKTLKPFDKVLVRYNSESNWCIAFFSHIDNDLKTFCHKFVTAGYMSFKQMIPYNEETKHLLGTNNQAPEFYIY